MNKYPKLHNFNDMFTPPEAMNYIMPYLDKNLIYWEACWGRGDMARILRNNGFNVVGDPNMDCLTEQPEKWDFLITNPPFNGNKKFIERAINLHKPFAFLIRLEHLGGVTAYRLFKDLDFKIIIPEKRVHYLSENRKKSASPFHSIWFTYGVNLPKQINYVK